MSYGVSYIQKLEANLKNIYIHGIFLTSILSYRDLCISVQNYSYFVGAFYNANHRQHNITSSIGKSKESNIDKSGSTVVTNEKRLLPRNNHAILTLKVSTKEDMAVEICTLRLICLWTPCGLPFKCSL